MGDPKHITDKTFEEGVAMCPTEQMKEEHAGIELLLDILAHEEFHRRWIV